jgi:Short chain fatty acids transporter
MKAVVRFFVSLMQRYLPDAFLFAVILTFVAFAAAWAITDKTFLEVTVGWGNGLWGILGFTMQMSLVVVTGHAMASSKPIKSFLNTLASIPKDNVGAAMLCAFVSGIGNWINWGFGLIIAALITRALARRIPRLDYGFVLAAGYAGFVIWHMGLSGSIPLAIASKGHLVENLIGIVPTTHTIFSMPNLIMSVFIICTVPILFKFIAPEDHEIRTVDPALLEDPEEIPEPVNKTPAQKLEYSRLITALFAIMGLVYLGNHFYTYGVLTLSLNIVIMCFMWLGIILHVTPIAYMRAVQEAIGGAAGIAVQFPLYGGIQGIMLSTGLAGIIANWFISVSTEVTFPLFTFWAAGLINIFVPSGGGQWVVQGPINIPAGVALGVSPAKVAMSIAYGDMWTNMIQPFWALPMLGIAKLGAKDIMGYCVMVLIWVGIVLSLGLLLLPGWAPYVPVS